jgi:hypothetical protein
MAGDQVRRWVTLGLAPLQFAFSGALFARGFEATAVQPPFPDAEAPVSPAGYAFAIWGLIYLAGCAFAAAAWRQPMRAVADRMGWWPALSFACVLGWLAVARLGPLWLTVPLILVMAAAAWRALVLAAAQRPRGAAYLLTVVPFGLFAGWLTAAVFVNAADVWLGYGMPTAGLSAPGLAALMAAGLGAATAAVIATAGPQPPYALAVAWALAAIAAEGTPLPGLTLLAAGGAAALCLLALWRLFAPRPA